MKRAVICVTHPERYISELPDYSIMVINPDAITTRQRYLLENSDWSLLITDTEIKTREGGDYPNERLFWYTSGTTGDSKFCSFTQLQVDNLASTICAAYHLTNNDRYVSIMPLWHAHGQGMYWAAQQTGCEINFLKVKDIRSMPKYHPTFITAIPDVLNIVANLNFDNLRFIRSASAPLPNKLYKHLSDHHGVPIIEAFGMTEALSHCFTNPLEGERRIGTIGLPSGITARIDNNGHLFIQGLSVYVNDWVDTGDLAEQDERGYYKILGRSKDQINVRGIKINPVSLEKQLLESVSGLVECVVFGTDTVKCLYVGNCSSANIVNFLKTLGPYCVPKFIQQVDTIPLSSSGKISRVWLDTTY
jgi:acyl-coenzyme A synthetase/AMP-(fatty) acid ligase